MVAQSPEQSIDLAKRFHTCVPGHCLQYVRTWLDIPSRDFDANAAWFNTPPEHRHTSPARPGSPVVYAGGDHGHIAFRMWTLIRTTDVPTGIVSSVPHTYFHESWGYERRGWLSMLNGVVIPYLIEDWRDHGDVYVQRLHVGAKNSQSVARLRFRLAQLDDIPDRLKPPLQSIGDPEGSDYGVVVARAVEHWQNHVLPHDVGGPKDGTSISNRQANRLFGSDYHVIEE